MIYRFFEKYSPEKGFQEPEINLKNRSWAELHYINRKAELSKTCFSIGKSTMTVCCIEISEKTGNWLAVMYDHYLYGLIWIDLFTPTKEDYNEKKEDEARILAAAFENQLRSIELKFESTIKSNKKSLQEDLQPLKETDERREQVEWYKNNLGDAYYLAAYDQPEMLWTYTTKIRDYLKVEKQIDQYDIWEIKERFRNKVTKKFDEAIDEMDRMVEDLPFY